MKKKFFAAVLVAICCTVSSFVAMAAGGVTYTFSGVNCVTDGSPNDVTNAQLTDKITVTTSGDMNRKYAAVTDLKHNNEVGTYPIGDKFKVSGSYIYLGTASVNDNSIITLNVPKIEKGSKVTLTFAKPTVTNNGSTLRNTGDPYAYFKIGDRYISINGDNFDTWRTESVVIGEDTETIEFHCDKWGAVAISKIQISDGDGKPLHNLNITSTQYANLKVNGIKFCADENGKLTIPSYPQNEYVTIIAEKDGYKTAETATTIADTDANVNIPLECETDAVYYESDFGNTAGTLALDGEFEIGNGIDAKEVTRISANVTFTESGSLAVNTDSGKAAEIKYSDGIYIGDDKITSKDNMEFTLTFDKGNNIAVISQNGVSFKTENAQSAFDVIKSISGQNVTLEYIGISYPDTSKITIDGPNKVSSLANDMVFVGYAVEPEYHIPGTEVECYVSGVDGVSMDKYGTLTISGNVSGKVTICAEYNGAKAYKDVEIVANPKIAEWEHEGNTINLHSSKQFKITDVKDEFGNALDSIPINNCLKDFKSSDESVIKIDQNGTMTAVGKGKATITANAYTGADNIVSVDYTVDCFAIDGITENDISYTTGKLTENENIISYKITYSDGTSEDIKETQIPATTVKSDGLVAIMSYDADGTLISVQNENVKAGDKVLASNGSKRVYLCANGTITKITDTDTTMDGYEIKHKAGVAYEISPVYKFDNVGDVKENGKTLDSVFDGGYYNITFKKAETWRGDIYVNGFMVGNNVDQSDADRKLTEGSLYTAEDIKVKNGTINVSMCDGSTMLDYVTVEKQPDFYERPQRIYVLGDSLACNYYGSFEKEVGGGRTGWGQVLPDFVNVPVTNLANSGQFAAGLYATAFPSVIENGESGDILLIECAYNDRNYSTRDEMTACVKDMIKQCREKGITPVLITPNASEHDYKPSVAWSSYLKDIAVDTDCTLIDLSKESYNFLYSMYGDNVDKVITKNFNLTEVGGDTLHSSYAGAYKWASIVAQGLKDNGFDDIINNGFSYKFTDTLGNEITAEIK
ncbi:MAG: hypothetical protein SOZ28_02190 [Clostridia bacterium]|nr:hypothetical protein [Clostridia bacterium]